MIKSKRIPYKFYLNPEHPAESELISLLGTVKNKSAYIKLALYQYFKQDKSQANQGCAVQKQNNTQEETWDQDYTFVDTFEPLT